VLVGKLYFATEDFFGIIHIIANYPSLNSIAEEALIEDKKVNESGISMLPCLEDDITTPKAVGHIDLSVVEAERYYLAIVSNDRV